MIHSVSTPAVNATPGPFDSTGGELPPVALGFLEQLRRAPLGAWADAGRRLEELDERGRRSAERVGARTDGSARAGLRQLVDTSPRVVVQSRRRVLDLAAVAQGFVHPADVSRMKKAALAAVLALVARPALGEQQFAELYEPFSELIPLVTLPNEGHGEVPADRPPS